MIDLAEVALRSPQPVQHWIVSWREGEQPTTAQADAAVAIFLDEMGLAEHQVIYALHRDTKNWHLHIAFNRVHPDSEKVVVVNRGFDHEVAHRAIARIERDQGWQREGRGLFIARPDGDLERLRPREQSEQRPSGPARDFEERVGARSAQRIALEVAAPIIRQARSWQEMNEALVREGIRFQKKGSGAVLWVGDEAVKASRAGRDCSMVALQKRFGKLPADCEAEVGVMGRRAPQPAEEAPELWQTYSEERARHQRERAARREACWDRQRHKWRRMSDRHRRERDDILSGSWRGRGDLLNATRSLLAARQAQEKAEQRDQQKLERTTRKRRHQERFPDFKQWLAERDPELAEQWRYRQREPSMLEGHTFEEPTRGDIRAFASEVVGRIVHYRRAGKGGHPAFTDRGRVIDIRDSTSRETVLAALQLSSQKWGTFTVCGDEQFQRLCVELAAEHGLKIASPELQDALVEKRAGPRVEDEDRLVRRPMATSIGEAYKLQLADIARNAAAGRSDPSRLDEEVAVRLRLSGHARDAIERVIKDVAPTLRRGEHRDWEGYARRAVDFAFGLPGSRLMHQLDRRPEHPLSVEGRSPEEDMASLERGRQRRHGR